MPKVALLTTETVSKGDWGVLERTRVPGGWLYRERRWGDDGSITSSIAFVPDPQKTSD